MVRFITMLYSLICYAIGVAALVGLILFVADVFLPVTLNTASAFAPHLTGPVAIVWNVALIALWGAQHTFVASPGFKAWWTQYMPAAIERSTYLVFVAIMTAGLVLLWVPLPGALWDVSGTMPGNIILGVYFLGWVVVLVSTFLINHFHLFGLQQAWQQVDHTQSKDITFRTPLFYKLVRHPMMTGVLISLWAIPELTISRLVFTLAMTVYVLVGVYFEEKTLVADLGEEYDAYRRTTPGLIPGMPASGKAASA
ncbi:methyltransferase family protein [Hyphomonas sp.]|jgi:protein-S-isoprenylcysteine O-methyltransferase Ste14|uniref:methyltransferase family protein n=1 Tax=Hyphomonas sp. TaxID=87 RepID=UPI0039E3DDC5